MALYLLGGLEYYTLVEYINGKATPFALEGLTQKVSKFVQGPLEGEGHDVLHLKAQLLLNPSKITLPGARLEFSLIPERNPGTSGWTPPKYNVRLGGYNWQFVLGSVSNSYNNGRGGINFVFQEGFSCETGSTAWPGTVSGLGRKVTTSFSGLDEQGNLTGTQTVNTKYWNGQWATQVVSVTCPLMVPDESDIVLSDDAEELAGIIHYRMNGLFEDLEEGFESHFHGNYSYVCADACESIRYDHHNTVLNTLEVLNFNKSVGSMYDSYKALSLPASPTKKVKQMASAYLGTKYGPRLTVSELSDIITAEHDGNQRGSATGTREISWSSHLLDFKGEDRVSFEYEYGVYNSVMATLGSWGVSPISLSDVWDAVPYSFVIDWFVDVSDRLENPARRGFIDSLPVKNVWASEKSRSTGSISNQTTGASVKYIIDIYVRDQKDGLESRLCGYSTSSSPTAQGHLPEMGAVLANILL